MQKFRSPSSNSRGAGLPVICAGPVVRARTVHGRTRTRLRRVSRMLRSLCGHGNRAFSAVQEVGSSRPARTPRVHDACVLPPPAGAPRNALNCRFERVAFRPSPSCHASMGPPTRRHARRKRRVPWLLATAPRWRGWSCQLGMPPCRWDAPRAGGHPARSRCPWPARAVWRWRRTSW